MQLSSGGPLPVTPTGWEVWTELVVPLVGGVGTVLVAAAALGVSWSIARRDRGDQERLRRAAFAAAVDDYLYPRGEANFDKREMSFDNAAVTSVPEAVRIARWVVLQENRQIESATLVAFSEDLSEPEMRLRMDTFRYLMRHRIRAWVISGVLDYRDVDVVGQVEAG